MTTLCQLSLVFFGKVGGEIEINEVFKGIIRQVVAFDSIKPELSVFLSVVTISDQNPGIIGKVNA